MRILILGSSGMLGNYVSKYLSKYFDVININRENNLDASFPEEHLLPTLFTLCELLKENDVIINCVGLIKQRKEISTLDFIKVNSLFPRYLADVCESRKINLIHVSTDCVFDGKIGNYNERDAHNAEDVYGKTKSLGEPENCTIIRTSIIGEEKKSYLSLIEWVKSNKNKQINGYTNHVWNGITCLQFAKICKKIIDSNCYWKNVKHIFSPYAVTKDELVRMINNVYELNINVNSIEAPVHCYRNLSTIYPKMFNIPSILDQLKEQREFYLS